MIPTVYKGLCDDAAMFPPGNATAPDAVAGHRAHRSAWYAALVGPLLVRPDRVAEVAALTPDVLEIVLVVPEGPDHVAAALDAVAAEPRLKLAGIEVAPTPGASGVAAIGPTVSILDDRLPEGVSGTVELRRGGAFDPALDLLAGTRYRAKLRTGGLTADAFPPVDEVAAFLLGCAARNLPFKCTAGLHHAIRHEDPKTGFTHHGFLNILVATAAAARGDAGRTAEILADMSAESIGAAAKRLNSADAARARELFVGYGTCDITEPLTDLTDLGLLTP